MKIKNIKSIGVLGGTNSLGASFAEHWKKQFPEIEILVSGRSTTLTNKDLVEKCDIVVFAVPIRVTQETMLELTPFSRTDQIWIDITSTKQDPVKWMSKSKAEVCGTHPTFGPMADISGQIVVLCPERISDESFETIKTIFSDLKKIETTAQNHDKMMGIVQNISHFSDMVFGETLRRLDVDMKEVLQYTSPSYILKMDVMGRLFHQSPDLYSQIATQNPYGADFTQVFKEVVNDWQQKITDKDTDFLNTEFLKVREALGTDFCLKAYTKSQELFGLEYDVRNKNKTTIIAQDEDKLNSNKKITIFGDPNSHTDIAAKKICQDLNLDYLDKTYATNFFEVFERINNEESVYGIVPYENSTEGSVFEVLDALFEFNEIRITNLISQKIEHHLIGLNNSDINEIKTISSHPQALAQSRKVLRKCFPKAMLKTEKSTAVSAQNMIKKNDPTQACIGPKALSENSNLKILKSNLATQDNQTKFIVIQRKPELKTLKSKSQLSLCFWFHDDKPGNLASVLDFFSQKKINLLKLDSRRADNKEYGGYLFFIDADVSLDQFNAYTDEFKKISQGFKILGSF